METSWRANATSWPHPSSKETIRKGENNRLFWYYIIPLYFCQVSDFTTHCLGVTSWKNLLLHTKKQGQAHSFARSQIPHSLSHCSWNLQVNRQLHSQNMSCLESTWLMLRWPSPEERLFLGSLAKERKVFSPSMCCQITNSTKYFVTKGKKSNKIMKSLSFTILGIIFPCPTPFGIFSFTELWE